jgi:hypothetical protein
MRATCIHTNIYALCMTQWVCFGEMEVELILDIGARTSQSYQLHALVGLEVKKWLHQSCLCRTFLANFTNSYILPSSQSISLTCVCSYIVAYRPVSKRWLCKQWPLLCNARNIHARKCRITGLYNPFLSNCSVNMCQQKWTCAQQ